MEIILDTNSLHNDYFLSGTEINKIAIISKKNGHRLYVPEVVIHEMKKHFKNSLEECYKSVERALKNYGRMVNQEFESPLTEKIVKKQINTFSKRFHAKMKDLGILVLNTPEGQEKELMIKSINRKKPFKDTGAGLPDAFIWASILKKAERFSEVEIISTPRIIFVSNNHRDFCASDKFDIHPDLLEELRDLEISDKAIKIVPDINTLVKLLHLSSNDNIKSDVLKYITAQSFQDSFLYKEITDKIMKYLPYKSFQANDLGFPDSFEDPSIDMLNEDFKFEIDEVEILNETKVSIAWSFSLTCLFDFYVYKGDLPLFDDGEISVYDWHWNDHYVAAQQEKNVWFKIEIIIDENLKQIENFEIDINEEKNAEKRPKWRSVDL